ncbi:MAG: lipid-A-disaccharide synthase, partial [Pseudomonadota bacterium]
DFLQAAWQLQQKYPDLQLVTPAATPRLRQALEVIRQQVTPALCLTVLDGQSRTLMQAADYILLASGTAVLEGMLAGRLMVAAYRVAPLTAWLIRTFKLLKVPFVTLPNNLAGEALVPELLQEQVTPVQLVAALENLFTLSPERQQYILQRFQALHTQLRKSASDSAANAILTHFSLKES